MEIADQGISYNDAYSPMADCLYKSNIGLSGLYFKVASWLTLWLTRRTYVTYIKVNSRDRRRHLMISLISTGSFALDCLLK